MGTMHHEQLIFEPPSFRLSYLVFGVDYRIGCVVTFSADREHEV